MIQSASCERVRTRLDPLLDGELTALEEARDLGHLEACAACAERRDRRAADLSSVRAALRAPAAEIGHEVDAALERVERFGPHAPLSKSPRSLRRLSLPRPTLVALATAAAAVLLLLALEQVAPTHVSDARLRSADTAWPEELRELRLPRIDWPGLTPAAQRGAGDSEEAG